LSVLEKETVFTEMCKFVAELAVKMRAQNCFCILSGKQQCMRIHKFSGSEGTFVALLGHPQNQVAQMSLQETTQQSLEDPPGNPLLALVQSPT